MRVDAFACEWDEDGLILSFYDDDLGEERRIVVSDPEQLRKVVADEVDPWLADMNAARSGFDFAERLQDTRDDEDAYLAGGGS